MRTIDETIAFYEKKAKENREYAKECETFANRKLDKFLRLDKVHLRDKKRCEEDAENCQQIASWLKELKSYKCI